MASVLQLRQQNANSLNSFAGSTTKLNETRPLGHCGDDHAIRVLQCMLSNQLEPAPGAPPDVPFSAGAGGDLGLKKHQRPSAVQKAPCVLRSADAPIRRWRSTAQ